MHAVGTGLFVLSAASNVHCAERGSARQQALRAGGVHLLQRPRDALVVELAARESAQVLEALR
eukprot:2999761-Pyramimonas_sp.AAC.1